MEGAHQSSTSPKGEPARATPFLTLRYVIASCLCSCEPVVCSQRSWHYGGVLPGVSAEVGFPPQNPSSCVFSHFILDHPLSRSWCFPLEVPRP